ncbi:Serine protease, subtilase family [Deinococcus gobiensis I-0]|uniref:Serine protease, subtilase family n=1 Tax=Deinococcus gobiensis (strain DSM 21396 / JCM 16679 / CGMCC 1.7299 / I-0) TaxID=745776 RepID=H8GZK1_DEIGI|nr:Serine protease, subtilase family [Deinococcus gobiensis I-0]
MAPALPELSPLPPRPATLPALTPTSTLTPVPAATPASPALPAGFVATPTDPLYARQWNLRAIRAGGAWALLRGQTLAPVTVAVLDTGYVPSAELGARLVPGYDFVSDPARSGDGDGRDRDPAALGAYAYHGEVIAGIVAAAHDGRGMAGLDPQARVLAVRVAGTDGMIAPQDLADALRWAAGLPVAGVPANPAPARILNLSLYADFVPLTGCDARVQAAVDAVTARGALVVAGAANDGADSRGYSPAGCRNVLTVTSATEAGTRPAYANWGRSVALAAPGGEPGHGVVVSSVSGPGGVREPNGTSFAAPHASGVAALLLAVRPGLTPAALRDLLTRTATPFAGGRCDPDALKSCGSGTLNAEAALRAALALPAGNRTGR